MIIGVPKEIKNNENRVALTPAGVAEFKKHGHTIYIQSTAGVGSGFSDEEYVKAGASILPTIEETYAIAEMIVKVKEPIESEYSLIKPNQLLFTYFHFASHEPLTHAMIKSGATCLAYETVEKADRSLPLLVPMSEVAGRMSIQQGAKYLEKPMGGRGILLGGVPGVKPANVLVLGGGIVGTQAAKMAAGFGARVTIMDISIPRLRQLDDIMPANVDTVFSNEYNIPFRCVTQWATHQTGKLYDTLGVKIESQNSNELSVTGSSSQSSVQNELKSVSTRKRGGRGKKVCEK